MKNSSINREPAVAGQFYPASAEKLQRDVETYFSEAVPQKYTNVRALISPHAGYVFSGGVAASAFNQLDENADYERIFLLASSHHYHFNGASVYCHGDFIMPYGREKVDTDFGKQLVASHPEIFTDNPAPHAREHSIEVQLPFLHYKLKKEYKIVPIVIGTSQPEMCFEIASALKPYLSEKNLFVISTDFSHYPDYESAKIVDAATAKAILSNNPENLLDVLAKNQNRGIPNLLTCLCGWTSVLTLLYMTYNNPIYEYREVDYRNSGDAIYGNYREVVGYWAIVLIQKKEYNEYE